VSPRRAKQLERHAPSAAAPLPSTESHNHRKPSAAIAAGRSRSSSATETKTTLAFGFLDCATRTNLHVVLRSVWWIVGDGREPKDFCGDLGMCDEVFQVLIEAQPTNHPPPRCNEWGGK